jgi:O-antigen/teichoic acid export membrane protein
LIDTRTRGGACLSNAPETPEMSLAGSTASAPSLRRNVAWALVGNVVYAGSQWAMLVILAKLTSPMAVGQFALGLALTAPIVLLLNLQLRAAQATDARGHYQFGDYLALRLATVGLTFVTVVAAVLVLGYRRETALVVAGIALAKCAESITDIFHGLFQRRERMDLIAKSGMAKSALSLAAFYGGLYLGHHVAWGVAGLALAWTAMLVGYDIPQARRLARQDSGGRLSLRPRWRRRSIGPLVRVTLPLGIGAMLLALNVNLPRYFVEHLLGERSLGIYAALAYFVVAGSTVVSAIGESAVPRLANYHAHGDSAAYRTLVGKLLLAASVIGALGVIVTMAGGRLLLQWVYGPDYAAAAPVFVWIMVAGLLMYIAVVLGYGLVAARRFPEQLLLLICTALVTVGTCAILIPRWGLAGAAYSLLAAAAVDAAGAAHLVFARSRQTGARSRARRSLRPGEIRSQ